MNIKSILTAITPIEEDCWEAFEAFFTRKTLKKNEILWGNGEVCKHLVFINTGLFRSFRYVETKEVSTNFFFENSFFYDDYSFITQNPCIDTYEALEQTEITVIPRAAINLMFDRYKSFERLGRKMVEHNHVKLIEQQLALKNVSSKDKYLRLISAQPTIIQRVPLKFIASYLDMTPEYLSKLRKDITNTNT
jgi:CRP-like cAMP-binding protein